MQRGREAFSIADLIASKMGVRRFLLYDGFKGGIVLLSKAKKQPLGWTPSLQVSAMELVNNNNKTDLKRSMSMFLHTIEKQDVFHPSIPLIPNGKYVHFVILRETSSFPLFQTDQELNFARVTAGREGD